MECLAKNMKLGTTSSGNETEKAIAYERSKGAMSKLLEIHDLHT